MQRLPSGCDFSITAGQSPHRLAPYDGVRVIAPGKRPGGYISCVNAGNHAQEWSVDGVPGFVPRLLRDPGVTLFRADEPGLRGDGRRLAYTVARPWDQDHRTPRAE
jgi:hypothetical protein